MMGKGISALGQGRLGAAESPFLTSLASRFLEPISHGGPRNDACVQILSVWTVFRAAALLMLLLGFIAGSAAGWIQLPAGNIRGVFGYSTRGF